MKNSFAATAENILTRKFGGVNQGVATPYTSGQFFLWFDFLPPGLESYLGDTLSLSEIPNLLAASCLSVTPPGGTLNSVDFTGLGGVKWSVPGNIEYGNSFTAKFLEFSKTPILTIFHSWIKLIRDYRTGISEKIQDTDSGDGWLKKNYAATVYYFTTDPGVSSIEYYACYDGVYPTKDPQDLYSGDVETVGRVDVEQEFKFDYMWHEDWVKEKCSSFMTTFASAGANIRSYSN